MAVQRTPTSLPLPPTALGWGPSTQDFPAGAKALEAQGLPSGWADPYNKDPYFPDPYFPNPYTNF